MAREVVIQSWCDPCLIEDDQRNPSTRSLTVSLSGIPKPQEIDVCEKHAATITAFMIMMDKYGRPADSDAKPRATQPALIPSKQRRSPAPSTTRQHKLAQSPDAIGCPECLVLYSPGNPRFKYLAQHTIRQHHKSVTDYSDEEIREATEKAYTKVKLTMP